MNKEKNVTLTHLKLFPGGVVGGVLIGGVLSIEKDNLLIGCISLTLISMYFYLFPALIELLKENKLFLWLVVCFGVLSTIMPYIIYFSVKTESLQSAAKLMPYIGGVILCLILYAFYNKKNVSKLGWNVIE